MAWKYGERTLKVGKGWTDNSGTKHPYNWMIWSDSYKTDTIGLTWEDDVDTSYDDRFYFAKDIPSIQSSSEVFNSRHRNCYQCL